MKNWYLMSEQTHPNLLGGYENDTYLNYKNDSFVEVLQTDIASTVILYSSDLSWSKKIKCVIQGNTGDTQLKSLERSGLFQIGTVKAGMYIYFEKRYWLITGYPGTNGVYEKATLALCQYKLKWQNENGKIIERWMNATSASKYDVGETLNYNIALPSNNFTLLLPGDNETMKLDNLRVFIDRNKVNPTKVFRITRSDDILYDYGEEEHGYVLSFIADRSELNMETDNQELGICDYYEHGSQQEDVVQEKKLKVKISGSKTLKYGYEGVYSANCIDADGVRINKFSYIWTVRSDFNVDYVVDDSEIKLSVDNEDYIGKTFTLQVFGSDKILLDEKEIKVVKAF